MSPLRIATWALPLTLLVALVAVLLADPDQPGPARDPRAAAVVDATGFPRAIDLPDGRILRMEHPPRRLFVANTAVLDAVLALGGADRLVAVPRQAATWSAIGRAPRALAHLPRFGEFLAESVLALEPDLVLCSVHSRPETVATLLELDVPTVPIGFPHGLADVMAQLRLIARLLGAEAQLAELTRELDARVAALREQAPDPPAPTAAFYTHDGSGGWTAGTGTLAHEVLELAGLRNVVTSSGHQPVTTEQMFALDPDVLVVPKPHGEVDAATELALAAKTGLGLLRAVRTQRVVRLHPSLFSTTSHEAVTAAEAIARAVQEQLGAPGEGR